jgi:outer membrane protein W
MKKIMLCALILVSAVISNAQSTVFKPFKVDLALGYAVPAGSGSKAGFLFAVEPRYAVNDNITLGLRMEAAVMARANVNAAGDRFDADVKASGSYVLTGDYYFNTNSFRPFAGLGAGVYTIAAAYGDSNGEVVEVAASSKLGAMPRIGFEAGHFRMAVEYNMVAKSGSVNNNYLGIKIGAFIGGGRISK